MIKKNEWVFKVNDIFNSNNKYSLWMLSFSSAWQDLYFVNKNLLIKLDEGEQEYLYYLKMNIGHLYEANNLLYKAMEDSNSFNIKNELLRIIGFNQEYEMLKADSRKQTDKSFFQEVIKGARHNIFHYNKGKKIDGNGFDFGHAY